MKSKRAKEILSAFEGRRVLVVGDCMLDHWLWGSVSRISPEAPVPIVEIERSTYTPGGAANVVHQLCKLGARVHIVGVVGKDDSGRRLRDILAREGADVRGLLEDADRPTTTKTRIIAHSQQVVRADAERRDKLNGAAASRLVRAAERAMGDADIVLLSDYNKGVLSEAVAAKLLAAAAKQEIPLIAQPKPENLDLVHGATVIALNEKEAFGATGLHAADTAGAEAAAVAIRQRMGCHSVLITRGAHGMTLLDGKAFKHVPALARQVYDVSGAGDTVVSVLTLAKAAGATLAEATVLANVAASVVVQKIGTATASTEEILEELRDHA